MNISVCASVHNCPFGDFCNISLQVFMYIYERDKSLFVWFTLIVHKVCPKTNSINRSLWKWFLAATTRTVVKQLAVGFHCSSEWFLVTKIWCQTLACGDNLLCFRGHAKWFLSCPKWTAGDYPWHGRMSRVGIKCCILTSGLPDVACCSEANRYSDLLCQDLQAQCAQHQGQWKQHFHHMLAEQALNVRSRISLIPFCIFPPIMCRVNVIINLRM